MLCGVNTAARDFPKWGKGRTKQIQNASRVAPLVVIPRNKLDKVVIESDAGLDIEDGGVGVSDQIGGDDLIFSVGKDTYVKLAVAVVLMGRMNKPLREPSEASLRACLISS